METVASLLQQETWAGEDREEVVRLISKITSGGIAAENNPVQ